MDLTFSEMSVDTTLAQKYLKENTFLFELHNDYNGSLIQLGQYTYDGKKFVSSTIVEVPKNPRYEDHQDTVLNLASKLKQNATLITQLEYYIRNIPIEDTRAQLNLIIQYIRCHSKSAVNNDCNIFYPTDPLLLFGRQIFVMCSGIPIVSVSKETAAICHLFVTLLREAGAENAVVQFGLENSLPLTTSERLNSGTVAVVSDDADIDSAVDKFIAVSMQAPWRLRRILVQESIYQQFKAALSWKCNLNKSSSKSLISDVLCSESLTYNDKTFLIDPVELTEAKPSVVTVEAYRTTKEMISLVQQYKAHYLSLWTNGIEEMNEVVHGTKSPIVWVNNVADFRGPHQVSEAVFDYYAYRYKIKKCDEAAKLCELSEAWLKLDFNSRLDILYGCLEKYRLIDPTSEQYPVIRDSLSACALKTFVDVGKDYVCVGIPQPVGIVDGDLDTCFSVKGFELLLQGNALIHVTGIESPRHFEIIEQAGLPVAYSINMLPHTGSDINVWKSDCPTRTRVVWTNSGTIFAN